MPITYLEEEPAKITYLDDAIEEPSPITQPEKVSPPSINLDAGRSAFGLGTERSTTFGGPPKQVGIAPFRATLPDITEAATTPPIPFAKFEIGEKDSVPMAVGKEAANMLISVPEFFTTPVGSGAAAVGAVAPAATAAVFTGDMLLGLGEQIVNTYKNWNKMTRQQKAVALTDIVGSGALTGLTGTAAARGFRRTPTPITFEPRGKTIAEMEDRFQVGKVVPPAEAPVIPPIERPVVPRETLSAAPESVPAAPTPPKSASSESAWKGTISFESYDEPTGKWEPTTRPIVISKSTIPGDKPWRATVFAGSEADPVAVGHVQLNSPKLTKDALVELSEQLGRYTRKLSVKPEATPITPAPPPKSAQVSSKLVEVEKPVEAVAPAVSPKVLGRFEVVGSRGRGDFTAKSDWDLVTKLTKEESDILKNTPEGEYPRLPKDIRDAVDAGHDVFINDEGRVYKVEHHPIDEGQYVVERVSDIEQSLLSKAKKPTEITQATVATEKTGAEPKPTPTKAETPAQVKRIARGVSGISRFMRETEITGPDILSWMQDNMKLLSKSNARQSWGRDKFNLNKSLWDDAPQRLSAPHHNIIYGSKGYAPDRVAQAAFDAGILKEPTVNELWRAIKSSSEKRVGEVAKQKRESKWIEEDQKQYSEWVEATKKGGQAVSGELLQVGDVLDVDGQKVEVTGKAEDGTVTLKDGRRFGTQKLGENETIYVETFEGLEGGEDFLPPEEQPKPKKAPGELFTAQETPFNLAGEKATFVEPTKEATGFGQETLTQNDLFNIQQVTKDVDPFKSAKAAQQLYGKDAVAKIQNQLRVMDSDPEVRKSFTKEQRNRLNEVLNVLRQQSPPAAGEGGISIGPGAQSRVGDAPLESQLNQLSRTIRLQSISPKEPFTKRLSDALDLAGRWAKGKDAVTQTLARMTAAKDSLWNSYKNLPPWNDFTSTIGRWIGADTETAMQVREFQKSIKQIVPSKLRREAITNWIQADGKDDVLRARMEASKPSVRKGYEVALNLNDAEKILARNIQSYFESRLKEGIDAGLLKQGVDDYVTQIWKRPVKTTQKLMADLFGDGTLNPTFRFARERIFNSYFEGEQAGYIPRNKDIGHLISVYDMAFNRALSARAMIRELQNGTAKDGNPIVMTSGQGIPLPAGESPPEAVLIKPNYSPKGAVSADGRQYKPIDHWALRDWKWASKVGDTPVFLQGDMLVHPDHFTHLQNVLKKSRLRQYPVTGGLLRAAAFAKQTKLSLSPFHTVQEGVHALAHRVNPINPAEIDLAIPEQKSLVDHGLMIADPRGYELFTEGMSGGGLVGKIPGLGNLQQWYTEVTFRDYIPRLKMSMAVDALERNRKAYANQIKSGKVTDDQIVALTARESNAAFGEQNYRMMGRSATTQDFLRLALLAPDFLEARFRFVGQALKPYGREQRIALALMGATLYTGSRVLNKALDDDYHWNKPFSVFSGGKEYRLRTILGDVQHLVNDPRSFWYNRLSPATRTAIEYVTSRDDRGIKRNSAEQFADFLQWFKPIPVQIRPGGTAAQSALASVGIPATIYGKQQELYEIMDSWRKRQSDPKIKEAYDRQRQETHVTSPYGPLRMALNSANLRQAKEEYLKLRLTRTPDQIEKTMAMNRPFTGSTVFEEKFKASLTPEEKKIYAEAKNERKRMYQRFQQMFRIPNR